MLRNGQRKRWPIIAKLTPAIDKTKIFRLSKNLKSYNAAANLPNLSDFSKIDESLAKRYVYVTDHLLKALLMQKRPLMPKFKAARQAKQKTYRYWKIENGRYNLYVDDAKVERSNSCTTACSENES